MEDPPSTAYISPPGASTKYQRLLVVGEAAREAVLGWPTDTRRTQVLRIIADAHQLHGHEREWLTIVCNLTPARAPPATMPAWWDSDYPSYDAMIGRDDSNDDDAPLRKTRMVLLCPDYTYIATRRDRRFRDTLTDQQHEQRFRDIHDYLTTTELLPRPFDNDPASALITTLQESVRHSPAAPVAYDPLQQESTRQVVSSLRGLGQMGDVMFLVMCGHGSAAPPQQPGSAASGTLVLSGNMRFTPNNLATALADFRGTLIVAYVMCHAEGEEPYAIGASAGIATVPVPQFHPDCRVVRIYPCGRTESIVPSQAAVMTRLLDRMVREAPEYDKLQAWADKVWPSTLKESGLPIRSWFPTPVIQVPANTSGGRFLLPLQLRDASVV